MRTNSLHKYINTLPCTATHNILPLLTVDESPERQAETIGTKMETKRVSMNQLVKPTKSKRDSVTNKERRAGDTGKQTHTLDATHHTILPNI
jgi:hypothetical protein